MLCIYHQFTARLTYKAVKFPSTWSNTSGNLFFFYNVIYLFTFGCAGSLLLWGLFSSGGVWASPWDGFSGCRAWARGCMGFSSRGTLSCSAGVGHVGSSQTRGQIHVSCIRRQILYPWATREAPGNLLITFFPWKHPLFLCSFTPVWSLRRPAAELWSWDWLLPSSWLFSPSPSRVRSPISWILRHSFPQGCSSLVACLYLRVEAMPLHRDWQGKDWLHIMSQTLLSPCGLKTK